ncbi:transposase [Lysinibacillus parviboronicapiens]|uniref:transposase n=1 Tax=Lysinibacillus parviboronicapiens TaxID=436516 RepID=UPI00142DC041|nr:transposase [Lysinibacillus parviboronicapiens]
MYDHELKKYEKEFKQTVVNLYRSGTPVNRPASEYGVSKITIYKWIKLHSPIEGTGELTAAEKAATQKENLRLKQDVDILKKGMTIFAQKTKQEGKEIYPHTFLGRNIHAFSALHPE